jgi:hypothetical protein
MPVPPYRFNDNEAGFRHYWDNTYTPDIETFIKHWQQGDCAEDVRRSLQSKLREMSGRKTLFVAEPDALSQRAKSWRAKGVPLKTLPLSLNVPETSVEKVERLTKLALQYTKEN